jgi:hypothetical protein
MHSGIHCSYKQEVDGKETADPALFWWLVGWFNTSLFSRTDWFLTRKDFKLWAHVHQRI